MYIHNYQIHNVLNEYRKQLIERPAQEPGGPPEPPGGDRIPICRNDQRQAIVDQVSADIVNRFARQGGPQRIEDAIWHGMRHATHEGSIIGQFDQFTYTLIDEHNQKITGTFEIRSWKAAIGDAKACCEIPQRDKNERG